MRAITVIRKKVATMANRLRKMGLTLSEAFKKAWELIKGHIVESKVAGVTKGLRQKALHRIATAYTPEQVKVSLVRELSNLYDKHAVKVVVSVCGSVPYDLGYIPSNLAYVVSALLDKGVQIRAAFKEVRGRYASYMNYGAVITLQL